MPLQCAGLRARSIPLVPMRLSRASRGGAAAATRILGATVTPAAAKASANSRRRVSDERIEHPLLNELEARGAVYLHRIAPSKQCLKVPSKSAGFRKLLILLVGLLPTLLMVRHPTSIGLSTHRGLPCIFRSSTNRRVRTAHSRARTVVRPPPTASVACVA